MEGLNAILDALNGGFDQLFAAAQPVAAAYIAYLLFQARTVLLKGVPAWLQTVLAGSIESYLQPIVENAVRHAEEWAQRQVDEGLEKAQTLGAEKLSMAKTYVLSRVPDSWISDERLGSMIDAALVKVGLGAAGAIEIAVQAGEKKIGEIPLPPAA